MRGHARKLLLAGMAVAIFIAAGIGWHWYAIQYSPTAIVAACQREPSAYKSLCYTNSIDAVLAKRGLKDALDLVAAAYRADRGFAISCHSNMHDLGAAAYKQFESTGHIDLTDSASYCGYGFYHGFMNEMLYETGSLDQAGAFCSYVGATLGSDQQYAEGACYHGIGHGVTDGTDPSLWGDPKKIAAPGLALCDQVATTTEFKFRCDTGVFNAVALMYADPKYKLDAHGDPYGLCKSGPYDATQERACYSQMNTLAFFVAGQDTKKALSLSLTIPSAQYRDLAIQSTGGLSSLVATTTPLPELEPMLCAQFSGDDHAACISGIVDSLMEFGTPGVEYERAIAFCESPNMSLVRSRACVAEVIQNAQGTYTDAKRAAICRTLPAALVPETCTVLLAMIPSNP